MIKKRLPPEIVITPVAETRPAAAKSIPTVKPVPTRSKPASIEKKLEAGAARRKWYIALAIVGVVALGVTSYLAMTGLLDDMERRVFTFINHAYLPGWVSEQIAKPVSNAVWGIVFLVVALLAVPKYRLLAWQYAVAGVSAYAAAFVVEHIVDRARPIGLEGYNAIMRATQDGPGFPSGHLAVLTALVLAAWPFIAWPWRIALALFVVLEAWSRVFLGVHAPLDVVGGVAVGAVVVAVIHLLPYKVRRIFKLSA